MAKDIKDLILEKGSDVLEEVEKFARATQDFATEQTPILIREILSWGLYSRITAICLSGLIMVISLYLLYYFAFSSNAKKVWAEEACNNGDPSINQICNFILSIVCIISSLVNFIVISNYLVGVIFILVAPRLYLLQELASLLKK